MQRLFRGRLVCGVAVGLALFSLPQTGRAQANKNVNAERVKFDTFDLVEIHGTFYPSAKGNKAPCAVMLHALGGSSDQDGWADLAQKLQAKDIAVLTFDFRGHGESTAVSPQFWSYRNNQSIKGYRADRPREQISYKQFTNFNNWTSLVDDIAAAKHFLDRKNDSGDCNSANVIVIGAEGGGTLGAMWIASEWQRRKYMPVIGLATGQRNQVEGQDIACAVYLSITSAIGVPPRYTLPVDSFMKNPVREKVPMYFLYGEQDTKSASYAKHLCETVLRVDKDSKLKLSGKMPIKDTKLAGRELLGKASLPTEDLIVRYITEVIDKRGTSPWTKRDADRTILVRVQVERLLNR